MLRSTRNLRTVNLTRRPGAHTYEARLYVPKRLQGRLGRQEIISSLRTAHRQEAERRLAQVKYVYFELFTLCDKCPDLPGDALLGMARRYLQKCLAASQEDYASTSLAWAGSSCPPGLHPGEMIAADFDEAKRDLGRAIDQHRYAGINSTAESVLSAEGHNLPCGSGTRNLLNLLLLKAQRESASFAAHVFRHGLDGTQRWKPADTTLSPPLAGGSMTVVTNAPSDIEHITFKDAVDRFIEEKRGSIGESGLTKHTTHLKVAALHFGSETLVGTITRPQVRAFRDLLANLPANFSKRFPSLPLGEIAALPIEERRPLLKPSARDPYIGSISSLFKYCVRMGFASDNPATDMGFDDPENARDKRHPFSKAQLDAIFSQPLFTGCDGCHWAKPGATRERGTRYWTLLIALLSGMRRSEIFNLTPARIILNEGQYFFDVPRSKTESGIRKVPVHPLLLRLGLLDFVRAAPADAPLFPDMTGDAMGKFFARLLVSAGVKTKKLTFHSFRHTFIDALRAAQVPEKVLQAIVGHASTSVTDNYGSGHPLSVLAEHVAKANFWGLGLDHLMERS